ncbi:MAG: hypothetical protein FJ057_05275 [Cyanobacteria bacterium K_DeepCast_0m_m1_088]|nr:hypothetical protein [Cyanobacteria bacterium K_DeepCast_0m_m1_088]
MDYQGNPFLRPNVEKERIVEIARAVVATAALECADNPCDFGRIQRSICASLQQTFPEFFDAEVEELD